MRFADYYGKSNKPVISFEFFPPKTDKGLTNLKERHLPKLMDLAPDFFTVTYGAMGTTQARTVEIASYIKNEMGKNAACHFTCVGASKPQLDEVLRKIHAAGIRNIVALRGDPPAGADEFVPPEDGCAHANELLAHIRDFEKREGIEPFGIAVAGYPEKHLEAPDIDTDLSHLKRKVETGADVVITQLFYDNTDFYRFLEHTEAAGINKPIVPGLMPILNGKQIKMITGMCGARIPDELGKKLDEAGDDRDATEAVGIEQIINQADDLLKSGVPGIHFYVMNKSAHMIKIMNTLRERGRL